MQALHQDIDPNGLLEYSVVYTDRALNHMSRNFQRVMNDISRVLKEVYKARSAVVVPGRGDTLWIVGEPPRPVGASEKFAAETPVTGSMKVTVHETWPADVVLGGTTAIDETVGAVGSGLSIV